MVICGRLSGLSFVAEPEPGCRLEFDAATGAATFPAPSEVGAWTLGISACANQFTMRTKNRICGTWYANIDVR